MDRPSLAETIDAALAQDAGESRLSLDAAHRLARVAEEMPDLIPRMLFVSGGVFTEKTEAFLRRPDVRALAKPFTPTAIRGEVERIMDLARAPRG